MYTYIMCIVAQEFRYICVDPILCGRLFFILFFFFWDSEDLCVTCISPDIHMTGFEAFSPSGPHPSIVTFCMVWTVAAAAAAAARCLSSHFHFSFFSLSRLSPFARLRAMAGNSAAGRLFVGRQ